VNEINIEEENEALEQKTKSLEEELKTIKENAAIRAEERTTLFTKLNKLTESKGKEFEKLKQSVQNLRVRQNCWYGIKCKRLFCNFGHSYLFRN
jgi:methyl-accepting chemotaxis protein